jgi:hypothetical protein
MYINKKNRFQFKFWPRFLGTSLTLFIVSLTQGYLESAKLFVAIALFLGMLSVAAIYAGTKASGIKKFIWSIGFVILIGSFASLLLMSSCYFNAFDICVPRIFQTTIVVYFIIPTLGLFLSMFTMFLYSFYKKEYHA